MTENILYKRSNDYRKQFFIHNKPFFKKYYFCTYCGRWLKSDKVTVDHLIPIKKVKSKKGFIKTFDTIIYRNILKLFKIYNINDYKNLVAACSSCNSKKGANTGVWILRGLLGKNLVFWIICKVIFIILLVIAVIIIMMLFEKGLFS